MPSITSILGPRADPRGRASLLSRRSRRATGVPLRVRPPCITHIATWVALLGLGVSLLGLARGLSAQSPTPTASLPTALATITTDTGDFAPGFRDFARYDTPDLCRAAAVVAMEPPRHTIAREELLDTLHNLPEQDTAGVGRASAVVRTCGQRFLTAATTPLGGFAMLDVALAAHQDSLARAFVARRLAAATTPTESEDILAEAIVAFMQATPVPLAEVQALVAQMDARGSASLIPRVWAHEQLAKVYYKADDNVRSVREYNQVLTLVQGASPVQWDSLVADEKVSCGECVSKVRSFYYQTIEYLKLHDPAALPALYQRYRREFLSRFPSKKISQKHPYRWVAEDTLKPDSVLSYYGGSDAPTWDGRTGVDSTTPYLHANYWCPVGHPCAVPADTLQPTAGKVSLLVDLPWGLQADQGDGYQREDYFARSADFIRRMLAKYGAAGLTVTVVSSTFGTTWADGVVTPAQEADRLRWYLQEYEHLPVNVALQMRHDQWRPGLDGRRFHTDTTQEERWKTRTGNTMLFDKSGHKLWQAEVDNCPRDNNSEYFCNGLETQDAIDLKLQQLLIPSTPPSTLSAAIAPHPTVPRAPLRAQPPTRFAPAHP